MDKLAMVQLDSIKYNAMGTRHTIRKIPKWRQSMLVNMQNGLIKQGYLLELQRLSKYDSIRKTPSYLKLTGLAWLILFLPSYSIVYDPPNADYCGAWWGVGTLAGPRSLPAKYSNPSITDNKLAPTGDPWGSGRGVSEPSMVYHNI